MCIYGRDMTRNTDQELRELAGLRFDRLISATEYAARVTQLTGADQADAEPRSTYVLPVRFYDDHVLRDGEPGNVVKRTRQRVTVELTAAEASGLLDDARFYAAMGETEFDRADQGIVKSARATVRAMARG